MLTHIALGACMGEAFADRMEGKKAMLWGMLAQSIPDIDVIASFWLDTPSNLLAHRGFTHSVLFGVIMALVLAKIAERWHHRSNNISYISWVLFFGVAIMIHIFLDGFNSYGVGWLEPFSHSRFSFNIIYVADPFFSIAPGIALIALLWLKQNDKKRNFWWKFGLYSSFLYLGYCTVNKAYINQEVKQLLIKQQIKYTRYFTTPAPLQNWLWYVVAGNDSGYYVGYHSVFDRGKQIKLEYFPRNTYLTGPVNDTKKVNQLILFSQQFYTIEKKQDTILFNDLRFGQVIGWQNPKEDFAFHYYLQPDIDNTLVVQRGRFAKWDKHTLLSLIHRIRGN